MIDKPLAGRIALVTGASRGIGAATAEALAAAGAHLILVARTGGGLEEVEERIHQSGGTATIASLDITDKESVDRLAAAVSGRWPALDILVLNAAILNTLSPVPSVDSKEFSRLLAVNLVAPQTMISAFDPLLRASDRARVIAMTSSVAQTPRAYWSAYGASKAGLENLVLSYADEVKAISSIRVAIVNPGATATKMRARAYPGEDQASLQQPQAVGAELAKLVIEDFETGMRVDLRSQ
jgi:NAD(P)-dependent dehydrogenase (short-subunit alcohol dehydrogenase family)